MEIKILLDALTDRSPETVYFLDTKSGKVYSLKAGELKQPQVQEFIKIRQKEPERFAQVPKIPSAEVFKDMEAFLAGLMDVKFKEKLAKLIGGGGGYRDFLGALEGKLEKEQWYNFRTARNKARLKNWLKTIGLGEKFGSF